MANQSAIANQNATTTARVGQSYSDKAMQMATAVSDNSNRSNSFNSSSSSVDKTEPSSATTTTTTTASVHEQIGENKKRRITFSNDLVASTQEVPRYEPDDVSSLFYSHDDFAQFQMDEQRRYERAMAKKIQKMVQDKMAPQIEEAVANGATPEQIEAMMPQTSEAIFQLIGMPGGIPPAPTASLSLQEKTSMKHHHHQQPANDVSVVES